MLLGLHADDQKALRWFASADESVKMAEAATVAGAAGSVQLVPEVGTELTQAAACPLVLWRRAEDKAQPSGSSTAPSTDVDSGDGGSDEYPVDLLPVAADNAPQAEKSEQEEKVSQATAEDVRERN